jgi:hypothetical protein
VGEIYCVLFSGGVVWLGVVLGGFIVGIVMCECEGGVIIWFGWVVIGMNCGVVGVFVCRVGVVVGVCVRGFRFQGVVVITRYQSLPLPPRKVLPICVTQ